jgi:hypothetical protein
LVSRIFFNRFLHSFSINPWLNFFRFQAFSSLLFYGCPISFQASLLQVLRDPDFGLVVVPNFALSFSRSFFTSSMFVMMPVISLTPGAIVLKNSASSSCGVPVTRIGFNSYRFCTGHNVDCELTIFLHDAHGKVNVLSAGLRQLLKEVHIVIVV